MCCGKTWKMLRGTLLTGCLLIVVVFILSACAGNGHGKKNHVSKSDKIILISENYVNCNLTISDELFDYLKADEEKEYLLDLINDYFNVIINETVDQNAVYIKAGLEKIDSEVRLPEVYEASNRVSVIVRIAEAGERVISQKADDSAVSSEKKAPTPQEDLRTNVMANLKKIASKGAVYGTEAIKLDLIARTAEIYDSPKDVMTEGDVRILQYQDYYIHFDEENGVSIVCGSLEAVADALEYFLSEYIQLGDFDGDNLAISVPNSELHNGEYLKCTIAGKPLEQFSLIYYCDKTYYDSRDCAKYLEEYFIKNCGVSLNVKNTESPGTPELKIVLGKTKMSGSMAFYEENDDLFRYQIMMQDGNLYILGGSDWAIQYGVNYLIDEYFSKQKNIPPYLSVSGSLYGKYLFEPYEGSNLRIMSNNVWDRPGNAFYWQQMNEDCSNRTRLKEMVKVYMAYNPDVLSLQELNVKPYYSEYLLQQLNQEGRNYAYVNHRVTGTAKLNYTPMVYNTETLRLLDSGSHTFLYGSNSLTKSYTWGYFKQKKTGRCFIAFSTHLWWRSDKVFPESTAYRIRQMTEICDMAATLIEKYNCPCFVMGDLNCRYTSTEYRTMADNGFSDCYDISTRFSRNVSGRFVCNANNFSYRVNVGTYEKTALDHILTKNLKDSRVIAFDYVTPNFYGKLSDHAPVYIDVNLN